MPKTADKRLTGKTALITGAASRIGLACAQQFSDLGAKVILASRRSDGLDDIARRIGDEVLPIVVDLSDGASVKSAVRAVWNALRGIDYLVHTGIAAPAALGDMTPDLWRRHIDVNLMEGFYLMRECALRMHERGSGSIVAIVADSSLNGMQGFCEALALELTSDVRINCVCPGPIDTPMLQVGAEILGEPAEVRAEMVAKLGIKRTASPDKIAEFVAFVATEANFATGGILSIDGGMSAG